MAVKTVLNYQIDIDGMKSSTCGTIGKAKKGGKQYFAKRFNNPVQPAKNGTMSAKVVARNQRMYDDFVRRKTRLNNKLLEISGEGGNLVPPLDFGTYEDHWIEFSELIDGAIPETQYAETIARLSEEERLFALRVAMGALATLHSHHIVHADLKLPNIMLVRNSAGHYVSKIIDFDGAFFEDDVPTDSVTGTPDYYSPEQAFYVNNFEDPEDREPYRSWMTTKSDIFTMGLVLHEYLTGEKPKPDKLPPKLQSQLDRGKYIYCWQVLLTPNPDGTRNQLKVSDQIKNPVYVALISDMLNIDAKSRPTANEVLMRLNMGNLPISTETWPEDTITIKEDVAKSQVIGLKKYEQKDREGRITRGYEIIEKDGRRFKKTRDELLSCGIAVLAETMEEPWPEDGMTWDETRLKTMFVSVCRGDRPGMYKTVDRSGNARQISASQMKMLRFGIKTGGDRPAPVRPTPPPPPAPPVDTSGKLWPEDAGKHINTAAAAANGLTFVGTTEMAGVKGYQFRDASGNPRFLNRQIAGMLKLLVAD